MSRSIDCLNCCRHIVLYSTVLEILGGSKFGIISETLSLAKIVYCQQYIPFGHNVIFDIIIKNLIPNYLKFDTQFLG